MLTSLNAVLSKAKRRGYAVGAFNVHNLEFLQAILEAATEEKAPVIIQTSEGAIHYAGMENIAALVRNMAKKMKTPVVFHLDHGRDMRLIKAAVNSKLYSSIMYDGSCFSFAQNISHTKKVVAMAHKKGINVEAELGSIGGAQHSLTTPALNIQMTEPIQDAIFVKETKCEALAVYSGTRHVA